MNPPLPNILFMEKNPTPLVVFSKSYETWDKRDKRINLVNNVWDVKTPLSNKLPTNC